MIPQNDPDAALADALARAAAAGRIGRRPLLQALLALGLSTPAAALRAQTAAPAAPSEFDVIIVGAGSAGSLLADALTRRGDLSVAVVEAGPELPELPRLQIPGLWTQNVGSDSDWAYRSVPQAGLAGRPMLVSGGRLLGGSGSINATIWLRGDRADFDEWERAAGSGWGYATMLEAFTANESASGDAAMRGSAGALTIERGTAAHALTAPMIAAAREAAGLAEIDVNGSHATVGVGHAESNTRGGRRHGPAQAWLLPALARSQLTLLTGQRVHRLDFEGDACRGVWIEGGGTIRRLRARREVILCTGAVGSPRLLMLAGIGPAAELEAVGVKVRAASPQVGKNLQDHLLGRNVVWASSQPVPAPMVNGVSAVGNMRSQTALAGPDVQLLFVHTPAGNPTLKIGEGWGVLVGLMKPRSRGEIRLTGARDDDPLAIDPRFLSDAADREAFVRGMEVAQAVGESRALAAWRKDGSASFPSGRAAMLEHLQRNAGTYFHYAGTCVMGTAASAVVDPELRVRGVRGLRIVDASVMPTLVSANPQAAVLMIARRAATLLA